MNVRRQGQTLGNLACRVVIASDQKYRNLVPRKPVDLVDEVHACSIVGPVAVEHVAGDHHEIDVSLESRLNQIR